MRFKFSHVDLLLSMMVIIWGVNFTVIKFSLRQMTPLSFNALRFILASCCIMLILKIKEGNLRLRKKDILPVLALGLIGNTTYQLLFIFGIHNTTASNTSLILAITPIFITLFSALLRQERVGIYGWTGVLLSFIGTFLILRESAQSQISLGTKTLKGNLLLLVACVCWALYTVFCVPLLRRYSPLKLTAYTTLCGSAFLVPIAFRDLVNQPWSNISLAAWGGVLFSFSGAIVCAYLIWYYSVQKIGGTRTSVYSNVVPIVALLVARIYLSERITFYQGLGAAIILLGVYLTRQTVEVAVPAESEF